jgi:hypothetical protein
MYENPENINRHSFNRCITIDKPIKIMSYNSNDKINDIATAFLMNVDELKVCVRTICKQLNISKKKFLRTIIKNKKYIQKNDDYDVFDENRKLKRSFTTLHEARDYLLT